MRYEEAHAKFIQDHLSRRTGERRNRLEIGHAHAEQLFCRNIWWEMAGNFDNLHPEYEIKDWRGRSYFADFALITLFLRLLIEVKGFRPHIQEMDRTKFILTTRRDSFLVAAGFQIISFAYEDVRDNPEICINLLRMKISQYEPMPSPASILQLAEREIIRLALQHNFSVTSADVVLHFQVDYRTARSWLTSLCKKGWLKPVYGPTGQRIVRYELNLHMMKYF